MYPIRRLLFTLLKAHRANPMPVTASGTVVFRCMPWDLDLFMEMNNGRVLTLYDLGRFDLSTRTGLGGVLKKNDWGFAVAGSTTRYRKRVKFLDKITTYTRLAAVEDRWFYMEQSMWVKGQPVSSVLLRTAVTSRNGIVDTEKVFAAMGIEKPELEPSSWVQSWVESEDIRPWPPVQQ